MTERNIAAEVFDGLREIREYRAGRRTLRTVHGYEPVERLIVDDAALRSEKGAKSRYITTNSGRAC